MPTATSADLVSSFADKSKEELEHVKDSYEMAGRVMAIRNMGKAAFVRVQDRLGEMQFFVQKDALSESDWQAFKLLDMGDFIGVSGTPMKTKTGELSLKLTKFTILTKSLRPLPEKYHGLTNVEHRYRQRYVDLIVNEKTRNIFIARAKIIRGYPKISGCSRIYRSRNADFV